MYNYSPYETLAVEEYILKNIKKNEAVLFLYSHPKAVIIGRNQNAWAECRVPELEADGGELARRISGGGAVYHDLGNLNFSFILNKEDYNLEKQLNVLCAAVKSLGINAVLSGRNDILAEGKKFSGNAFCFKKNGAFHHGTVLIDADISQLAKYLSVSPQKIRSKGINSVKSRVINLTELSPSVTADKTAMAIKQSFQNEYGAAEFYIIGEKHQAEIDIIKARNASWEWKYGKSPKFDITFERRFDWGAVEIKSALKDGLIKNCTVYSDAMNADFILAISNALCGVPYNIQSINAALYNLPENADDDKIIRDLTSFLAEQNI